VDEGEAAGQLRELATTDAQIELEKEAMELDDKPKKKVKAAKK